MHAVYSAGKLIFVCGLPGSGKTTHARQLETKLRALRLCPDEWMDALSIDIWDEARRAKTESLQWELGQQFLAVGGTVVIEWGTWGDRNEMPCGREHENLARRSNCTI